MPLPPRRPALPPRRPSIGLTPDAESLRKWQAATYHFGALRQHAPTPPKASHATARDGDLARVDADFRYHQAMRTRQMALEAGRQKRAWAQLMNPAPARYAIRPTPNEDYYKPEATRQRAIAYKLAQQKARLLADHPLEAQVGEGVVIGGTLVTSAVASEVLLLRLASGLRYAGMLRLAAGTSRLTWAGGEAELLGARAAWQEYRALPIREMGKVGTTRLAFDLTAQGGANYLGSKQVNKLDKLTDAALGVNLIESGMAIYGLRPVGIGVGSAFFQYSVADGFQSPLNGRISWRAFGAQALIGTTFGYLGEEAGVVLNKRIAYRLYRHSSINLGHDVGYPVWLGSSHLFHTTVPASIGVMEEHLENQAPTTWEVPEVPAPDSLASPTP